MSPNLDVLHVVLAAAMLTWAVYNIPVLRRSAGGRSKWAMITALGVGEAFRTQYAHDHIDGALSPGWAANFYHAAFVVAAASALNLLLLVNSHSRSRRLISHGIAGLAIAAAVAPWFIHAPTAVHPSERFVPDYYDADWQAAVHSVALVSYLGWAETTLVRQSLMHAREMDPGRVRTGIRLACAGVIMGLVCLAGHAAIEAIWFLGDGPRIPPLAYSSLDAVTLGPGALLATVGVTWQRTGDMIDDQRRRMRVARMSRQIEVLRPHWSWLTSALPQVCYFPTMLESEATTADDVEFRHTRMTTEIQDATRQIMSRVPHEDRELYAKKVSAHRLSKKASRAAVHHLCLHAGIKLGARWRSGAPIVKVGAVPSPARLLTDLRLVQQPRARRAVATIIKEDV